MDPKFTMGLTPEQAAEWTRRFAPTSAPPASFAAPAPAPSVAVPMRPPAADPMEAALAAANRAPGRPVIDARHGIVPSAAEPPAPPASRNLFSNAAADFTGATAKVPMQAPPRNDWAGAHAGMVAQTAQINKARLDGTTFAEAQVPDMAPGPIAAGAGGGGPVRVIPGHRSPASWHIKEGTPVSGAVQSEYDYADAEAKQALTSANEAGKMQAAAEAGYLKELGDAQKGHMFQERIRQDAQMSEMANANEKLAKYTQEAQEAPTFESVHMLPGEAGSFVAGLGVAIGAGIAAATGGENGALKQLNSAIQQSVDRQKREVTARVGNVDLQQNMVAKMKDQFGTIQAAEDATWVLYLEKAKTDLAKMAADTKNPELQARYQGAMSQLDTQIADRHKGWSDQTADQIQRTDVMTKNMVVGGGMVAKPRKGLDNDVKDLAKFNADQKLPEQLSELEGLDRQIDTLGKGEITGVGEVADKLYSVSPYAYKKLYGDHAVAQRQVYQGIRNVLKQTIAGASMSPEEKKALDAQLEGSKDSESMKRTIQAIRQRAYYQQRNVQASVPTDAVDEYKRRGGTVVTMERDKKLTPTIKPIGDK